MAGELALALRSLEARALGWDDAPALQALLLRCAAYFRGADGRPPGPHAAMERISEALGDAAVRLWGLAQPGRPGLVGLLELRLDEPAGGDATIVLLLLDSAQRGRGLGREVVAALETALRGAGFDALHLGVQAHEQGAHAFWSALGFSPVSEEGDVTNYVRPLR